jgi:imidazoleglycerol-phosphate dehydratase
MNRIAEVRRVTRETQVHTTLDLDGRGSAQIDTGVGFFDHLLSSLAHHALFDLSVTTEGDIHIDDHHTVEDTALALGEALDIALGDRAGINRFGDAQVPMDEALATAAVDLSGRPYSVIAIPLSNPSIGNFTTQNLPHALESFARTARTSLHVTAYGRNDHHIAEAAIKALARSLRVACEHDPRRMGVASTKGSL